LYPKRGDEGAAHGTERLHSALGAARACTCGRPASIHTAAGAASGASPSPPLSVRLAATAVGHLPLPHLAVQSTPAAPCFAIPPLADFAGAAL
jgi:hypothetical protein